MISFNSVISACEKGGKWERAPSLFDEVQRSNMSKACSTLEEAERTRAHYLETKGTESLIENVDGQWLVYREEDRKVLKSIRYSPANLSGTAPDLKI